MKVIILIIVVAFAISCEEQVDKKIITELDYFPRQKDDVTDEEYRKWTTRLKSTYEQIEADSGKIVYADHLNIATAYIHLKEPKQKILDQFYLAQKKDLETTAEIFPMIYSKESLKNYLTDSEYDSMISKFEVIMANKVEETIDLKSYAKEGGFDLELVVIISTLNDRDQEYRQSDTRQQQILDEENIKIIDSLYQEHNKYIGKSLVGDEFEHVMWSVTQHSELGHQEKYLPIIHQAVIDGELAPTPLKMLIDRVYKKKYGYQIFGSQSGGELADDETIEKVKSKYNL